MSVGRNTVYNIVGSIAPAFVSLISVPIFLHTIGESKYGVLGIVWMFLGYFGIFDPGLSRATTYHMARLRNSPGKERQAVYWTAVTINSAFGVLGGLFVFVVAPLVFARMKMPDEMRGQVMSALPWLALAVPVGTIAPVLSGTLEGLSEFGIVNSISFFGTLCFQLIPLSIALLVTRDLAAIIGATVLIRLVTALLTLGISWYYCKAGRPQMANRKTSMELFSYGSWITITNLISPVLSTLDKFLIGSYLNVAMVTVYTIPDNLARRISILPGSLIRSLFPRFSESGKPDQELLYRSYLLLLGTLTPITVAFILGLHLFLQLWVGRSMANSATQVGVVLVIGIFFNGLAYLPSMYLQATGRPKLNATFHLIEIVPHVIILFIGIYYLKLLGVALAMVLVSGLDAVLLFYACDLKVWKRPPFQFGLLFIAGACLLQHYLSANSWISYAFFLPFTLMVVAFGLKISPDLKKRVFGLLRREPVVVPVS
jgi:O-antigen/teichoic acid export membrane protein